MSFTEELSRAARIAIETSLAVRPGERVVIVTNPNEEVRSISAALEFWAIEFGADCRTVVQNAKTQLDAMDQAVWEALRSEPDVYVSISANKIGKDLHGLREPYEAGGKHFTSITSYLVHGKKCSRGFWSPGIAREWFCKTVDVDYAKLRSDCAVLATRLAEADEVHVTAPGGTDLVFSIRGRSAFVDDGDFSKPGTGGNLPAGETYVSPEIASAHGTIVYDGSMATNAGTLVLRKPIRVEFEDGYVAQIAGGEEAETLAQTIREAEEQSASLDRAIEYRKNARHLGELGIGVNPRAEIVGNMLVDEKVASTCHFAIGSNYDGDAPALIHLDGVVLEPTIELKLKTGGYALLLEDGKLIKKEE